MHAETLYACDFFSMTVWTFAGLKRMYVLAFIHIDSRIVFASPPTANPNSGWVCKQAEAFIDHLGCDKPVGMMLLRDNDGKFQGVFDDRLAGWVWK
jgi:putative transposase